jgi:hypothetical protein
MAGRPVWKGRFDLFEKLGISRGYILGLIHSQCRESKLNCLGWHL